MTDETPRKLGRRDVLRALGTAALLGSVSTASAQSDSDPTFVLEQGNRCYAVEPLGDGTRSVESFYEWGLLDRFYSSFGVSDIQQPDTSLLFLYHGTEGLSLVFVHDKYGSESGGGAASVRIDGVPESASWPVMDDRYDGPHNYDRWQTDGTRHSVDWTWAGSRTDGGALRGLGDEFLLTVDMRFNEQSHFGNKYYDGEISDWQFLTGDARDPDRTTLKLDQPLVLRTGQCQGEQWPNPGDIPVEVNPRKSHSRIDMGDDGRVPVGILSADGFDPRTVVPSSITFGPDDAAWVDLTLADVNGDGRDDLLLWFDVQSLGLDGGRTELRLTGETVEGVTVVGSADVTVGSSGDESQQSDSDEKRESTGVLLRWPFGLR